MIVGVFQEKCNWPHNVHVSVTYEGNTWNFTVSDDEVKYLDENGNSI